MQTFAPLQPIKVNARVLDRQRLGKQRIENMQLASAILGVNADGTLRESKAWTNHPAALMWKNSPLGLLMYQNAIINEWVAKRGYKDTCWVKTKRLYSYAGILPDNIDPESTEPLDSSDRKIEYMPRWWFSNEVHASHRAALLFKDYGHYSQFGWTEEPKYDYIWPEG